MKKTYKYFYLSVLLVSFVCLTHAEKSPVENLHEAMRIMYEREHEKLLKEVNQLEAESTHNFNQQMLGDGLVRAAHYSNLAVVQAFIKAGAPIDYADRCGFTALIHAAEHGKLDIVQECIKRGANINLANKFGNTAFLEAVKRDWKQNLNIVRELIKAGVDINQANTYGQTALLVAVKNGAISIVRELLNTPKIVVNSKVLREAEEEGGKMLALFQPFMDKK